MLRPLLPRSSGTRGGAPSCHILPRPLLPIGSCNAYIQVQDRFELVFAGSGRGGQPRLTLLRAGLSPRPSTVWKGFPDRLHGKSSAPCQKPNYLPKDDLFHEAQMSYIESKYFFFKGRR